MEVPTLKAEPRTELGTKRSRRLRASGGLPGIIYGHGEAPQPFSVQVHDVQLGVQHGARLVALDLDGRKQQYLIKEIQYDHLGREPVHIDLARVDLHERIRVKVAVELRGTPAGVSEGGILDQLHDSIEVECLVSAIPDTLHPSVAHLHVGESLLVKDLELPPGVTAVTHADEKIALVHIPATKKVAEEAAEAAPGPTEPERIGRVAEPDEQAEGNK